MKVKRPCLQEIRNRLKQWENILLKVEMSKGTNNEVWRLTRSRIVELEWILGLNKY